MSPGTIAQPSSGLTIDHVSAVTKPLKDLGHNELVELGGALGLLYPNLSHMNKPILQEMVACWLKRKDNVMSITGEPTWSSLIKALKSISQPGIAQKGKVRYSTELYSNLSCPLL